MFYLTSTTVNNKQIACCCPSIEHTFVYKLSENFLILSFFLKKNTPETPIYQGFCVYMSNFFDIFISYIFPITSVFSFYLKHYFPWNNHSVEQSVEHYSSLFSTPFIFSSSISSLSRFNSSSTLFV